MDQDKKIGIPTLGGHGEPEQSSQPQGAAQAPDHSPVEMPTMSFGLTSEKPAEEAVKPMAPAPAPTIAAGFEMPKLSADLVAPEAPKPAPAPAPAPQIDPALAVVNAPELAPEQPAQPNKIELIPVATPVIKRGEPIMTGPIPEPIEQAKAEKPVETKPEPELVGLDKTLKSLGIDPKHKPYVIVAMVALMFFLLMKVIEQRKFGAPLAESIKGEVSVTKLPDAKASMVVLVDPDVLVRAAVGQGFVASSNPKIKQVDTDLLRAAIEDTVAEYREKGYMVMDRREVYAAPDANDLTPIIADRIGLDLSYAEVDITGMNGSGQVQQGGSQMVPGTEQVQ